MTNCSDLQVIIGLENHVQLKTKTKIFSPAPVTFNAPPNTAIHPIDLGYPGFLPAVNEQAVKLAIRVAHLLKMKISKRLVFDRKSYVYSDLSKGFQISQFFHPLAQDGRLTVDVEGEKITVIIRQLQIEEDTAKQTRTNQGILLDYNRAGIGLIEIITTPCLRSSAAACQYVRSLQQLLLFSGASDADMSRGSLRCDVNISLSPNPSQQLGTRVEIKNLNSIANIAQAINFEINRQTQLLRTGQKVPMETRRFNEQTGQTEMMRRKTDDTDYKFMVEPNIHPISLSLPWLKKVINECPPTSDELKSEYQKKYKIKPTQTTSLMKSYPIFLFFQRYLATFKNQLSVADVQLGFKLISGQVINFTRKHHLQLADTGLNVKNWATLIKLTTNQKISFFQARQILNKLLATKQPLSDLLAQVQAGVNFTPALLTKIVTDLIQANQQMITNNQNRPQRINSFLIGQVMKLSQGQADPQMVQKIIHQLLKPANS